MAPPPCETRIFSVGKSLNTLDVSSDTTAMFFFVDEVQRVGQPL
jgi:hypothetical protein